MTPRKEEAMFAMICTDNLRYKKTKYYDSEYIVKGTLHINEHAYAFSHITRVRLRSSEFAG